MNNIFDTVEISSKIEEELKQSIKGCIIRPSVAVINIGNNELNEVLIKQREEACNKVGIYFRYHNFEDDTPELTIINKIKELNNDDYVNGIMVQLPLPEKYNEKRILNTIINSKDIDGLTDINVGRLMSGRKTIVSCFAQAIMTLLKEYEINLEGKEIVIIGKDKLIARPLLNILLNEGATVTVCHSKTIDLKKHTIEADIVISAMGIKDFITQDMVKSDCIIIDAGCSLVDGKVCGDVDFNKVSKKVSLITPKDGITNIVLASFLKNILLCYNNKK